MHFIKHTSIAATFAITGLLSGTTHADQMFALSWEATFCESHPSKAECQGQSTSYGATNLSLHGLWPQSNDYCGVSSSDIRNDKSGAWYLLPAVVLNNDTRNQLNTYMPGTQSYLERHEWIKHGTCSGLSQQDYFATLVSLASQFSQTQLNQLLSSNIGNYVAVSDIINATQTDYGNNASGSIGLYCSGDKLSEIRFLMADTVYTVPLDGSQFIPNSSSGNCPDSVSIEAYPQ